MFVYIRICTHTPHSTHAHAHAHAHARFTYVPTAPVSRCTLNARWQRWQRWHRQPSVESSSSSPPQESSTALSRCMDVCVRHTATIDKSRTTTSMAFVFSFPLLRVFVRDNIIIIIRRRLCIALQLFVHLSRSLSMPKRSGKKTARGRPHGKKKIQIYAPCANFVRFAFLPFFRFASIARVVESEN